MSSSPIDRYLDRLFRELTLDAAHMLRVLTEAEDHLRESARNLETTGLSHEDAEKAAVARFGSPRTVARRFASEHGGRLLPESLILHLGVTAAWLTGIGFIAIGLSGLLAAVFGIAFGKDFVSGDAPGVTYTAERCAQYQSMEPAALDCAQAAVWHHFGEVVGSRTAAGVLGMLVLCALVLLRRRYKYMSGVKVLPTGFLAGISATAFGTAGTALLGLGLMELARGGGSGAGAALSAGTVAAVFAGIFLGLFVQAVSLQPQRD